MHYEITRDRTEIQIPLPCLYYPPKMPAHPVLSQFSAHTWTGHYSFIQVSSTDWHLYLQALRNCRKQTVLGESHQPSISCGSGAPACTRAQSAAAEHSRKALGSWLPHSCIYNSLTAFVSLALHGIA